MTINILQACRIARIYGFDTDRWTIERDIIPNMQQANEFDGRHGWSASEFMHRYMASEAYERGCDTKAAQRFEYRAYGD